MFKKFALLLAAVAVAIVATATYASEARTFNIPPGELAPALESLAKETGLELIFAPAELKGLRTQGVVGTLSPQDAVAKLINGTRLTIRTDSAGAILIAAPMTASATAKPSDIAEVTPIAPRNIHLAQSDQNTQTTQNTEKTSESPAGDSEDKGKVQEIVVTAQKREEKLQDVPLSISVLSGDDLDRSTEASVVEALSSVPGVSFGQGETGMTNLLVRGVGAQSSVLSGASPVAYYVDSMSFGFAKQAVVPDPDGYDLERVEVLRGPQGTLYGANALNGVVRVITKDANADALEFKARTSASSTDTGGENYRGDLAINVPIVEGKLAARAVLGYQDLSGWIDRPNEEDINEAERRTMRLKINAQPTEQLSVGLSAWKVKADYDGPSVGRDSEHTTITGDEPMADDYEIYGLNLAYDFPAFSITSTTSYLEYDHFNRTDVTDFFGTPLGFCTPAPNDLEPCYYDLGVGAETFAQEVNLTSSMEGSWRWSAGGMYRDSSDIIFQDIEGLIEPIAEKNTSKSYAVFGELTRLFRDGQWELTAGLRYFEDDVSFRETARLDGTPPDQLLVGDDTFDATTTRLALTWHPTETLTAYVSYGEGFRSGAFQNSEILSFLDSLGTTFPPAEPDELKNYEVGTKGSLWGGLVNYDMALYYIDWQDVQLVLNSPVPGFSFEVAALVNGTSASGAGVDFALTARPVDPLEVGLSVGWNDLTVDEDVLSGSGRLLFEKGDRLARSPEWTATASADYVFPVRGLEGRFSTSANYASERAEYGFVGGIRTSAPGDAILIARTSLSIGNPDRWTASLFVDNVNNEKSSPLPRTVSGLLDRQLRVRPRTVGVQFEYRLN